MRMTGYFAKSLAGHDKDEIYLIIGEDVDCVILSDGRLKKIDDPKKKNKKHIQVIKQYAGDNLMKKITDASNDANDEIRLAIKRFKLEEKNV